MKQLLFILLFSYSLMVSATQITADVDRNPVSLSDSFQLTFSANEAPDGNPDFEPLMQDFDILNQSHTSQTAWVNGKRSATIKWTLQLMAKHAGQVTIPSINFGQDKSEALSVNVSQNASKADIDSNEDIILKVEASPLNPYVQSQVLYTLKLYRRVNIAQARLDEPKISDAVTQKLGDDSNYNSQIKGVDYLVTERKYAIFPQKSGTINIPPLNITAEVVTNAFPRFNGFFNQQASQTKKVSSNAVKLEVRSAPVDAKMPNWLPAEELQLKEEWSGDNQHMKVGEPLTRTLVVVARGATVGLLPELAVNSTHPQLKTYPDQPNLKEMPKPEGVFAIREEKIAIIPSTPGSFTLPAIEVPWFNVGSQKVEVAKLPATTITVLAGSPGANPTAAPSSAPNPISQAPAPAKGPDNLNLGGKENKLWQWLAISFGIGWLVTLGYFLSKRRPSTAKAEKPAAPAASPNNQHLVALKQACQTNDPGLAKRALLQWAEKEYQVKSLSALAEQCDARLRDEILALNHVLYAPINTVSPWQGSGLLKAYNEQQATKKIQQQTQHDKLEPLHRL